MKKVLIFVFVLFLWLVGGLIFKYDAIYYALLNVPEFVINPTINSIIWIIIYVLISISIMIVSKSFKIIGNNDYFFILIVNYLANMFFPLMFYNLKSPFLGFVINAIILVGAFYLILETRKISKKATYFVLPYLVYSFYVFLSSLGIWVMNF